MGNPYSINGQAAAVKTRMTKTRRGSRQKSPTSTKNPRQAPWCSSHRRLHQRSWLSSYPTPMPVAHPPLLDDISLKCPFCRLRISETQVTLCCSLGLEQLRALLIHQHTANLPGLPCRLLNQPSKLGQRNFESRKRRNQSPPSPITWRSVKAAARPQLATPSTSSATRPPSGN